MGTYTSYHRLPLEKFCALENDFHFAQTFCRSIDAARGNSVWSDKFDEDISKLSLEKEWASMDYLLNGRLSPLEKLDLRQQNKAPLLDLFCGHELDWPQSFVPESALPDLAFLTPPEVQEIFIALQNLPTQTLRTRFEARGTLPLYSQSEVWNEASWTFLARAFFYLQIFCEQAATNNEVILISSG